MEYGTRHPVSIKKERQMALGALIAGGCFLLLVIKGLFSHLFEIRIPNPFNLILTILCEVGILAGIIIAALPVPNAVLKALMIIVSGLAFLLSILFFIIID